VRLEISGADLIARGFEPSEKIGKVLKEVLRKKVDGEIIGTEQEMREAVRLLKG